MESCSIFIVEDSDHYTKMMEHYLSPGLSFKITAFPCRENFSEQLHNKPDIFILDYSLSTSNTQERYIKFYEAFPEVPAIIICEQQNASALLTLPKHTLTAYVIKNDTIQTFFAGCYK